jgi:hypothetical protein
MDRPVGLVHFRAEVSAGLKLFAMRVLDESETYVLVGSRTVAGLILLRNALPDHFFSDMLVTLAAHQNKT